MKISIIIPVYNVEQYIEECLQSVMSQVYNGDIECLVVDDCGQDNSIRIAQDIISSYTGGIAFRILYHDKNKGLSAARNTGLRNASGDYVYFLDSDDYIYPDCIQSLVDSINRHPLSEIVVAGAICSMGSYDLEKNPNKLPEYSDDKSWIIKIFLNRGQLPITAWNKLLKKDFLLNNDLFFMEDVLNEDEHYNFVLAQHLHYAAFCFKNTYYYNQRQNSIMTSLDNELKKQKSLLSICQELTSLMTKKDRTCQVVYIFQLLHDLLYSKHEKIRREACLLLYELYSYVSIVGKIILWSLLHLPKRLTQNRFFYSLLPYLYPKF